MYKYRYVSHTAGGGPVTGNQKHRVKIEKYK